MSLRKSPTLTPALLAANRRNAQKSTGPRTERGKNWSRVNRLRSGLRSRSFRRMMDAVLAAMPGEVRQTARALLPPHLARHPLYIDFVEEIVETDLQLSAEAAVTRPRVERVQKSRFLGGNAGQAAGVNRDRVGFPPAVSSGLVGDQGPWAKQKMTFQAGMSLKTSDCVAANGRASGVFPATPAASAGSRMPAQQKTTFQAGMSLKTNESVVTSHHQDGFSPAASAASNGAGKMPALHEMTFQPGMSLKTSDSVAANGRASGVSPATPAASAGSRMPAQQKTTFQAGMSLKTNESVVTSRHQDGFSPAASAASNGAGKMPALHETTFQAGMSLKTDERDAASDRGSRLAHEPPTPSADAGKMLALQKTTFQPGMSLKTKESVSPNRHERRAARAASSNARRASRLPALRRDQFDDGAPIDPNELSDEDIATILDKSRKAGFSQSFFDWVEREILSKRSVPRRNLVDNQAPGK